MKKTVWITQELTLAIQGELISRFGGLSGIRDKGLLLSALNRPQQLFHYGEPTLFEMAATYAEGIVKNHPFLDGNKRAGFMVAYTFLAANGWQLIASEEEAVLQTLALAAGGIEGRDFALWLKRSCEKRAD